MPQMLAQGIGAMSNGRATASVISFFVDELPMTRNESDRKHWRALADEKKRWVYLIQGETEFVKAVEPCDVTITFRTIKPNDPDNLFSRCKSPLDALQRAGIITNDNADTITLHVKQELVKHRKDCGTLIELVEILPFTEYTDNGID
jgi:Holliday junction resolvase RusA-like endonuclease